MRTSMSCFGPLRLHPCKAPRALRTSICHISGVCAAHSVCRSVSSWLQGIEQQQSQQRQAAPDLCLGILQQAEYIEQQAGKSRPSSAGGAQFAAAGRGISSMGNQNSTMGIGSNLVVQQCIEMPVGYTVPKSTTVPAYQLVGIFRAMLGYPVLPQGARSSSLEAKWGLLSLLLLHATGQQQQYQQKLQQLLDQVLLQHAANKVAQVLVNPHVPLLNKQAAEQRYQQLYATCNSNITAWVTETCATDKFQLLQPALLAISEAIELSIAAGNHQPATDTSSSGRLMEETTLQVLQASLPPGWSLVPSLHLLGADGEIFQVEQGCKYEVDMLVLDEQGVAVAVVEVKLAAANPLMSLFNDVNALLNLIDRIAGKTVTGITKSAVSSAAAASTAAVAAAAVEGASTRSSVLAKARAATLTAPFGEQLWQEVHVKVHEDVTPIYVIGKHIGKGDVVKGLASLVDSSALKILAKSAATTAAALPHVEQHQQRPQNEMQIQGSHTQQADSQQRHRAEVSDLSEPDRDPLPAEAAEPNAAAESGAAAASGAQQQLRPMSSSSSSSSTDSESSASRASNRVQVKLSRDMQDVIASQICNRLGVLKRCKIYSLSAAVGVEA